MGKLDAMTKEYLSQNEVFADAFNFLIYGGDQVIQPESLHELDTVEIVQPYGADDAGEAVQRYRDVLKGMNASVVGMEDKDAAYLILGIESQSDLHYAMPVKNMLYDAMQYAKQVEKAKASYRKKDTGIPKLTKEEFLSGFRKSDRLVPVITLVVYFGAKPWDAPLSITDMLHLQNPALLPFIPDYKINLISPSALADEEFTKFRSGLGAALKCVKHTLDEDFDVLEAPEFEKLDMKTAVLVKEISNIDINLDDYKDKEGRINMCVAMENTKAKMLALGRSEGRNEGLAQGRNEGLAQGRNEGKMEMAKNLKALGMPDEAIAKAANVAVEVVRQWLSSQKA